jgi:hypothetical protein
METQWFPVSKEVQDTEVMRQGVGFCLLGQRRNFGCRLPGKGRNQHGKVASALLDKKKQQLVSKDRGKLSKGILFLQDNSAPHKTAITHQNLADLHVEILKHLLITWKYIQQKIVTVEIFRNDSNKSNFDSGRK